MWMGYDACTKRLFFTKRGLEIIYQADFTEEGKEVFEEGRGVTKQFTERREKMVFLVGGYMSMAVKEEMEYNDSFCIAKDREAMNRNE